MEDLNAILAPEMLVRHRSRRDQGYEQVKSNIAAKVTVIVLETGKIVIDGARIALIPVFDARTWFKEC